MRKFSFLLASLLGCLLLYAQTTTQVNFTFTVDPNNNAIFTNTSQVQSDRPLKAYWSFGDGTITGTPPLAGTSHHYVSSGTYQVCLKIFRYNNNDRTDSTLLGSECKSVIVQQQCEAGFQWKDSAGNNSPVHYVTLTAGAHSTGSKPIKEICWNFGDGSDTCILVAAGTDAPLLIKHKYAQQGNYKVCLRVKYDGGCVAERCNTVELKAATIPESCTANFEVKPQTATPFGRRFLAQPFHSQQKKPFRICWRFGDGRDTCIQYASNYTGDYLVEHRYEKAGDYEACVTIQYEGGCEMKKCNLVRIEASTTPDGCQAELNEAPGNESSRERRYYVGLMAGKRAEKICWTFGDGTDTCVILSNPATSQQLSVEHKFAAPGNYQVCAKVFYAGGCTVQKCRQTNIAIAHSNICGGFMTDSLISQNTIRFKGTGIHNANDFVTNYNWTFGDGTTATGQTVNHTYAGPGRYSVCLSLRTNTGCETKICKTLEVAGNTEPQLVLAPNPVIHELNAVFRSQSQQLVSIRIYNANGIMVKSYSLMAIRGRNTWTFNDVSTLPTGVYSMIVQSSTQFATAIFFKQ